MAIDSGSTLTIDTLSHEGLMEDQGKDPDRYLAQFGVKRAAVLDDVRAVATSGPAHEEHDDPHIVTGPVRVRGARPGDILKVEVLELLPRVPYGFISNRHGLGALAGEFPQDHDSLATRDIDTIVSNGTVSHFAWIDECARQPTGRLRAGADRTLQFPLAPFLGLMGVAVDTDEPVLSIPPGLHGGNIDVKHIVAGSALYLPVQIDGASFYTGDPHFAQGNGEVALTAFEASLRATLRLTVLTGTGATHAVGALANPFVETPHHWVPMGMHVDLDEAMRLAVRNAVRFLESRLEVPPSVALAYLSAAADFEISQVVDVVKGVHCMIRKADFAAWV